MPILPGGDYVGDLPGTPADPAKVYGAASMGFSVLGGLLKGMAAYQAGSANAATDRRNAALADLAAGDAVTRGSIAAEQAKLRGSQLQGQQKAAAAASGVSVNSGSVLDLLTDTSLMSELDAKTIANSSAREAWGYSNQASNFRTKAGLDDAAGKAALTDSILGGVTGAATYGSKMVGMI